MRIHSLLCSFFLVIFLGGISSNKAFAQDSSSPLVPVAQCKEFPGSIFKPCICPEQLPAQVKYRPAVAECGGKAAAVLFGPYANSFSTVLRDKQDRDRWPASGYHRCSKREVAAGLNKCSAFKCQKVLKLATSSVGVGAQQICCFGEAGNSSILRGATRMTVKVQDIPGSTADPLLRICLQNYNPTIPLN